MSRKSKRRNRKVGRNELCPCGSGKKYKKCHGFLARENGSDTNDAVMLNLEKKLIHLKAKEKQREVQQGKGKPIISNEFQGSRVVLVGDSIKHSKSWMTFHDFLLDYIKETLGSDWGNHELQKNVNDRHPILIWYENVCQYQNETIIKPGKIYSAPMIGSVAAYIGLAYNIYLLEHNLELQKKLVKRLKNKDQFLGAYYEIYVAACFIQAGFDVEFEDEDDPESSHCEFVATSRKSGRKFSVEAKARMPGKENGKINTQLRKALKKRACHDRIIFIDVNMPEQTSDIESNKWMQEAITDLRNAETRITIDGNPAPTAYVILTNHPFSYDLENADLGRVALAEGFKIPGFRYDAEFDDLRSALDSRESHREILDLMESLRTHNRIPSTFDGENPSTAFGELNHRLIVGNGYLFHDHDGNEVLATLRDVALSESDYTIHCIFEKKDGGLVMVKDQLSDEEIVAYNAHPDTFFGLYKNQNRHLKEDDPIGIYDFFYESYGKTPKERLLELMKDYSEKEKLAELSQEELAKRYCEGLTYSAMTLKK